MSSVNNGYLKQKGKIRFGSFQYFLDIKLEEKFIDVAGTADSVANLGEPTKLN